MPTSRVCRLSSGRSEYLEAEAVYAVSHEGALHLEDVLTRRTRISIEERDRGVTAAPEVAALMASLLGWDSHRQEREVTNYLARVEAERSAQAQPDDEAANASRFPRLQDGLRLGLVTRTGRVPFEPAAHPSPQSAQEALEFR